MKDIRLTWNGIVVKSLNGKWLDTFNQVWDEFPKLKFNDIVTVDLNNGETHTVLLSEVKEKLVIREI